MYLCIFDCIFREKASTTATKGPCACPSAGSGPLPAASPQSHSADSQPPRWIQAEYKGPRRALIWPQRSCHQVLGEKWSPKSAIWGFGGPRLGKVCWSILVKGKGKFGVWVHSASTARSAKFLTPIMTPTNNNVSVLNVSMWIGSDIALVTT